MITELKEKTEKEQACREILSSLPDWFGNPESVGEYAASCRELPVWADICSGTAAGLSPLGPQAAAPVRYT